MCKNVLPKELQLLTSSDKKYLNKILNWPKSEWATLEEEYRKQIRKEDDPEDDNDDEEKKRNRKRKKKIFRK